MRSAVTLLPLCAALLAAACTSHTPARDTPPIAEAPPVPTPEPVPTREPEPEPAPRVVELQATISSIAFAQDCPDEPVAPPPPSPAAPASAVPQQAMGDTADRMWPPPCRQSTMQLTVRHDGDGSLPLSIVEARLVDPDSGSGFGKVAVRGPTRWDDAGHYVAWDEHIPAGPDIRASYKLSASDDRVPPRSVLEVDVRFEGRIITLRSPEFHLMPPEVMVT